jgi:hypothetical protein
LGRIHELVIISRFSLQSSIQKEARKQQNPDVILTILFLHTASTTLLCFNVSLSNLQIFPSWQSAVSHDNDSSCPSLDENLKETSALASSSFVKSSFMN